MNKEEIAKFVWYNFGCGSCREDDMVELAEWVEDQIKKAKLQLLEEVYMRISLKGVNEFEVLDKMIQENI